MFRIRADFLLTDAVVPSVYVIHTVLAAVLVVAAQVRVLVAVRETALVDVQAGVAVRQCLGPLGSLECVVHERKPIIARAGEGVGKVPIALTAARVVLARVHNGFAEVIRRLGFASRALKSIGSGAVAGEAGSCTRVVGAQT